MGDGLCEFDVLIVRIAAGLGGLCLRLRGFPLGLRVRSLALGLVTDSRRQK